jgi:hypothetical protein
MAIINEPLAKITAKETRATSNENAFKLGHKNSMKKFTVTQKRVLQTHCF